MRIKKIVVALVVISCAAYASVWYSMGPARLCQDITDSEIHNAINADFNKNIPRFRTAHEYLGTVTPKLIWGEIDRNSGNKLSGQSFTAIGPNGTINYDAIYTCSTGNIEYTSEPNPDYYR